MRLDDGWIQIKQCMSRNSALQTIDRHNHNLDVRSIGWLRRVEIIGSVCLSRLNGHCLSINSSSANICSTSHCGLSEQALAQENPKQDMP